MNNFRIKNQATPCKMFPDIMLGSLECRSCKNYIIHDKKKVKCDTPNKFDVFLCVLFEWHRFVDGKCVRCGINEAKI